MSSAIELKRYFLYKNPVQYSRTWQVDQLSALQGGVTVADRTGNLVKPYSLDVGFYVLGSATVGTTDPQPYRIIIFQDMGGTTTLPISDDLLATTSAANGVVADVLSPYNYNYVAGAHNKAGRFRILYDKQGWVIPSVGSNVTGNCATVFKCHISGKRMKAISFADATSGGARGGKIYMAYQCGLSTTVTNNNYIGYSAQLRYTDA